MWGKLAVKMGDSYFAVESRNVATFLGFSSQKLSQTFLGRVYPLIDGMNI